MRYDDLAGVPYAAKGRSMAGLDCAGLVMEVYRRLGHTLPDPLVDPVDYAGSASAIAEEAVSRRWLRLDEPELHCVVVLQQHPDFAQHLGVYVGGGRFLHAVEHIGVTTDHLSAPVYRNRIRGFYRYVG